MITEVNNENVEFNVMVYPAFFGGSPVDHTYIKFENGITFPCGGGSTGGEILKNASGKQDIEIAKRFNETLPIPIIVHVPIWGDKTLFKIPTGDTGVIYAINGVCHMMANRILVQSKVMVKEARGYGVSSSLFGNYGLLVPYQSALLQRLLDTILESLPKLVRIAFENGLKYLSGSILDAFSKILEKGIRKAWQERLKENGIEIGVRMKNVSKDELSLYDKLDLLYSEENLMVNPNISLQEYETVLRDMLDERIDDKTMQDLIKCMEDFHSDLAIEERNAILSNKELIDGINQKVNNYLQSVHKLVGDEKYEKLFNAKPNEEIKLFNYNEFESMLENVKNSLNEQFKE